MGTLRAVRTAVIVTCLSGSSMLAYAQPRSASEPPPAGEKQEPSAGTGFTWTVSERARYAGLFNQFRPGLTGDDRAVVFRTTIHGEFAWRHMALGGEVQDARAYLTGARSNVSTALVNPLDLLQAYVQVGGITTTESRVPEVQMGRFSMELGSGRLIAQEVYRDVTRTFTGAKVRWRPDDGGTLTVFGVFPVATLPDSRDALLHNRIARDRALPNQRFWGGLYEREGPRGWLGAEVYLYRLAEHDDPPRSDTRDRKLWTTGLRLYRAPSLGDWDLDVESAWQHGRAYAPNAASDARALDVSARWLHAHAGYSFARAWSPRIGVEYEYGSGDADPADGRWNRFDGLFGHRRVELGPTSIYGALGRENIETLGVRISVAPNARVDAFAVYRVLRLAAATDAFAGTGVRDPAGRSGRDGGQQIDVRFRTWVVTGVVRFEAGATHLMAGGFLQSAPNATHGGDTTFLYGDVTYTFGSKKRALIRR